MIIKNTSHKLNEHFKAKEASNSELQPAIIVITV